MTLMNGLIHQGRAYLWTDTALWDQKAGEQIGHGEKAISGTLWPWAAVHSGHWDATDPDKIKRRLAERPNLTGEGLLRDAIEVLRLEAAEGRLGRLLIALPCSQYGARLFMVANDDLPFAKAYTPYETVEYMCSGNGAPWAAEFAGRDLSPDDMRRFIELQTQHPSDFVDGWSGIGIGGNILEIEVTGEGVESRVLRTVEQEVA